MNVRMTAVTNAQELHDRLNEAISLMDEGATSLRTLYGIPRFSSTELRTELYSEYILYIHKVYPTLDILVHAGLEMIETCRNTSDSTDISWKSKLTPECYTAPSLFSPTDLKHRAVLARLSALGQTVHQELCYSINDEKTVSRPGPASKSLGKVVARVGLTAAVRERAKATGKLQRRGLAAGYSMRGPKRDSEKSAAVKESLDALTLAIQGIERAIYAIHQLHLALQSFVNYAIAHPLELTTWPGQDPDGVNNLLSSCEQFIKRNRTREVVIEEISNRDQIDERLEREWTAAVIDMKSEQISEYLEEHGNSDRT